MPDDSHAPPATTRLARRLLDIYRAPRLVYTALRVNGGEWYDWVVPTLLAASVWAVFNLGILPGPEDLPRTHPGWGGMSEEERQAARAALALWRSHVWFSLPLINSFAGLAATALLLVPLCRWILRREVKLRQMLAVKAYAGLVAIPRWLLLAICYRLGVRDAAFGPAAFLAPADRGGVLGQILVGLDLFDLWQAIVVGVGLAVMTGRDTRAGVVLSLSLWIVWVVLGALVSLLPTEPPPA